MRAGLSDVFDDLFSARLFYQQASAALEHGIMMGSDERCFAFQDFALGVLVMNSLGELPVEMYYPEGLHRLAEHDAGSPVSYVETLRVYLDQNMSVSKTAQALFVHRSTLLERITRIERILGMDLRDPEERLKAQLLLKAVLLKDSLLSRPAP